MAEHAHATESHENPGILGGLCDGAAVGLGSGLVIGGVCFIGGWISGGAWVGLIATNLTLGVILGSVWGKNRGY